MERHRKLGKLLHGIDLLQSLNDSNRERVFLRKARVVSEIRHLLSLFEQASASHPQLQAAQSRRVGRLYDELSICDEALKRLEQERLRLQNLADRWDGALNKLATVQEDEELAELVSANLGRRAHQRPARSSD